MYIGKKIKKENKNQTSSQERVLRLVAQKDNMTKREKILTGVIIAMTAYGIYHWIQMQKSINSSNDLKKQAFEQAKK